MHALLVPPPRRKQGDGARYLVSMSFIELYNERLTDLLEPQARNGWGESASGTQGGLNLKLNEDGGYSIVGVKKVVLSDINQVRPGGGLK
eukprot:9486260-Pyramimonas_sp.AAC.2